MKMPEKHDLLAAILAAKEQRHRGNPCVCNGIPSRRIIMAVRLQKRKSTQRCAPLSPSSFVTFSTSPDFEVTNLAYITSVFISYVSTDSISFAYQTLRCKKAGVEDGRNQ